MPHHRRTLAEGISVTRGEPRIHLPHHGALPYERLELVSNKFFPGSDIHIAVHYVEDAKNQKHSYAEVHDHNVDEINLILSTGEEPLTYRILTHDSEFEVEGPAAVYIDRGTPHAAEALSGSGIFVCIVRKGKLP